MLPRGVMTMSIRVGAIAFFGVPVTRGTVLGDWDLGELETRLHDVETMHEFTLAVSSGTGIGESVKAMVKVMPLMVGPYEDPQWYLVVQDSVVEVPTEEYPKPLSPMRPDPNLTTWMVSVARVCRDLGVKPEKRCQWYVGTTYS